MNFLVSYQNHLYQGAYGQQHLQMASTLFEQPIAMHDGNCANQSAHPTRGFDVDNSRTFQQDAVSVGRNLDVLAFAAMLGDEDNSVVLDNTNELN
jgi:hypothetical protein